MRKEGRKRKNERNMNDVCLGRGEEEKIGVGGNVFICLKKLAVLTV